jgi:hypothetical protein
LLEVMRQNMVKENLLKHWMKNMWTLRAFLHKKASEKPLALDMGRKAAATTVAENDCTNDCITKVLCYDKFSN